MEEIYTQETKLLNFHKEALMKKTQHLLSFETSSREKMLRLYAFAASLPLGYSYNDDIPASRVLNDGYGQCNTKVTLLMALARAAGVPCRVHAYRISKEAQQGRIPEWVLRFAPADTLFFWPQFYIQGSWVDLQQIVHITERPWDACPFDGAKYQLQPLKKQWIVEDQGFYPAPDDYFRENKPSVHGLRLLGWHIIARHFLNKKVC